jgi:hypothetical protein
MLPFDPSKDERLVVRVPGADGQKIEKTYRLRFGMRELLLAEAKVGLRVRVDGGGVEQVISVLTDGTVASTMDALSLCLGRHHEGLTNGEMWQAFDADPEGVQRAIFSLFGKSLPEAKDPNDQAAAMEILTEETVPLET